MIRPVLLAAALLAAAAAAGAAKHPFQGPNCDLDKPPPQAGDDIDHGALLKVHPRAKDIGRAYDGCQTAWAETRGDWPVVGVTLFERGEAVAFWNPPPGETTCRYRNGRAIDDPRGHCPPAASLKLKAMPAGCARRILLRVGDTKACKAE